jgi:uncharacterized integral membrane protein
LLRKILTAIVVIPLVVVLVGFAVANRQIVTVSLDPFDAVHPAYALTLPLFAIVFVILIAGVVIGGAASWLGQRGWRRASRRHEAEARQLRAELDALRRQPNLRQPRLDPAEPVLLPPTLP